MFGATLYTYIYVTIHLSSRIPLLTASEKLTFLKVVDLDSAKLNIIFTFETYFLWAKFEMHEMWYHARSFLPS